MRFFQRYRLPHLRNDQWIALLLLLAGIVLGARQATRLFGIAVLPSDATLAMTPLPQLVSPAPVPVFQGNTPPAADPTLPPLTATAVYMMDRASGSVLYELNGDAIRYPASTAKMMTALVARRAFDLGDIVTVKQEAYTTGTVVGLKIGEQFTVENLLKAMLIPSGNDAAFALANYHQFGYQGFTSAMNALAKDFHLDRTLFRNPSGLDLTDQTSTARDLAILANEVMKDPVLRDIVGTKTTQITDETGKHTYWLKDTNELLGKVPGVIGIKTGTTEFAGENLITAVERDGHEVIIVLLGSQHRFEETQALIEWVFAQYRWEAIKR